MSCDRRRYANASVAYHRKFRRLDCCVYCGGPRQCLDHVMPLCHTAGRQLLRPSERKAYGQGLNCVPACLECNSLAGVVPFKSIREKRKFIQGKLRKKYRVARRRIIWDREELEEIGHNLKTFIVRGQRERARAEMRCDWPYSKTLVSVMGLEPY